MALPYPEGEVYFKRSTLKYPGFAIGTDDEAFYSNILVENVWNRWYCGNADVPAAVAKGHPRSKLKTGKGQWYETLFAVWDSTHVLFGDKNDGTDITREVVLGNNLNFNEVRDFDQSDIGKTHLAPVPMGMEKYMYIDMTIPIRTIYFPVAAKSSQINESLCTYLMVDFRLRMGVKMRSRSSGKTYDVPFSFKWGLGFRANESLCIDIQGIYAYLVLPSKMRNPEKTLYQTTVVGEELINLWGAGNINDGKAPIKNTTTVSFSRDIDLATVLSDSLGVDVTWTPYEYDVWAFSMLQSTAGLGLGFSPMWEPALSVIFTVAITAITDPDFFQAENVLKLSPDVVASIIATGKNVQANLPKGFLKSKTVLIRSGS